MLSVVADSAIPELESLLPDEVRITRLPSDNIVAQQLKNTDALLVRSVTQVNQSLLQNTSVKFVGSATTGIDHLDTKWLQQNNIMWANSSGANAGAVMQYVVCCIAWLQQQNYLKKQNLKCGVIGAGKIGSKVIDFLKKIGARVLVNDPPRAEQEKNFHSIPLDQFRNCDLITVHVPLHDDKPHSTFHLMNHALLAQQKKCALINTSRGEVLDSQALKQNPQIMACLDVWENEPLIDRGLLERAVVATPHIAGYTVEAKQLASTMICQKLCDFFKLTAPKSDKITAESRPCLDLQENWQQLALAVYNPGIDSQQLKQSSTFKQLRENYQLRKTFSMILP